MRNDMRNGMSELPEELSGAELDAVTGGQAIGSPFAAGGLVNVAVGPTNVDVLRGANIDVIDDVTLRDIANNNNVGVGALVQVLGGAASVITGQTQESANRTDHRLRARPVSGRGASSSKEAIKAAGAIGARV